MELSWRWQEFAELTGREMHEILAVRQEIFVVEQNCVYRDADNFDSTSWHLTGRENGGMILAYVRLTKPGTRFNEPSIGRVLTRSRIRRKGWARQAVALAIDQSRRLYPGNAIRISAQLYLKKFYEEFGFQEEGQSYEEDGIEHIDMVLTEKS